MATKKKYDTMSTKKLEALLEVANDAERENIEHVLAEREAAALEAAEADANEELTPEEAEALAYAEEHDGENPMYKRGASLGATGTTGTLSRGHGITRKIPHGIKPLLLRRTVHQRNRYALTGTAECCDNTPITRQTIAERTTRGGMEK